MDKTAVIRHKPSEFVQFHTVFRKAKFLENFTEICLQCHRTEMLPVGMIYFLVITVL